MNRKKTVTKNIVKNRIQEIPTEFESLEDLGCFYADSVNLAGLDIIIPNEFAEEDFSYEDYFD